MTGLRVLVVNDYSSGAFLFQKYLRSKVNVIYFNQEPVISTTKDPLYFEKKGLTYQVSRIKALSKEFDVFVCFGWIAAAICYLANVNYIMYFVDSYFEPKDRIRKRMFFAKEKIVSLLFAETIKNASKVVTAIPRDVRRLESYHPEVRLVLPMVDPEMFNPRTNKIDLGQSKFTFISPQRIDRVKNHRILWDSVTLTKSDFVVLQTDWGSGPYYQNVLSNRPDKVKIIPKIRRELLPSYYVSSDALLGQISFTTCGSVEREAALCGLPIFCYANDCFTESDPFYKGVLEPSEIAEYLDRIVVDKDFRRELADTQSRWISEHFDNNKIALFWEQLFENSLNANHKYSTKTYFIAGLKLFDLLSKN
jgi:glycosyltransferase involved in cell wall biosynthesis